MVIGLRWKLFLLLWLGICLAMSTHAQETDFDDVPDLPAVGLPGAVVRSYEVQSDETGVIFRDGFEQPVIEDWGRRTRGRKSGSGT